MGAVRGSLTSRLFKPETKAMLAARKKIEEFDAKVKKVEIKVYCHTRLNSSQAHQHNRPLADTHST
jgi:hypothetical protein